jgi:hypothetical protein
VFKARIVPPQGYSELSSEIELELIDVTPAPGFARFKGPYNRMLRRVEMFRRMFIWRRIAAADVAADQAEPQMHPAAANFQTVLTTFGGVRVNVSNLI